MDSGFHFYPSIIEQVTSVSQKPSSRVFQLRSKANRVVMPNGPPWRLGLSTSAFGRLIDGGFDNMQIGGVLHLHLGGGGGPGRDGGQVRDRVWSRRATATPARFIWTATAHRPEATGHLIHFLGTQRQYRANHWGEPTHHARSHDGEVGRENRDEDFSSSPQTRNPGAT